MKRNELSEEEKKCQEKFEDILDKFRDDMEKMGKLSMFTAGAVDLGHTVASFHNWTTSEQKDVAFAAVAILIEALEKKEVKEMILSVKRLQVLGETITLSKN